MKIPRRKFLKGLAAAIATLGKRQVLPIRDRSRGLPGYITTRVMIRAWSHAPGVIRIYWRPEAAEVRESQFIYGYCIERGENFIISHEIQVPDQPSEFVIAPLVWGIESLSVSVYRACDERLYLPLIYKRS